MARVACPTARLHRRACQTQARCRSLHIPLRLPRYRRDLRTQAKHTRTPTGHTHVHTSPSAQISSGPGGQHVSFRDSGTTRKHSRPQSIGRGLRIRICAAMPTSTAVTPRDIAQGSGELCVYRAWHSPICSTIPSVLSVRATHTPMFRCPSVGWPAPEPVPWAQSRRSL